MNSRSILIDGYWLQDGPPSGRNVVRGLIDGWVEAFPEDEVFVALPSHADTDALHLRDVKVRLRKSVLRNQGLWTMFEAGSLTSGCDAIITQNFTPVIAGGRARRITFIHDAMFKSNPEWFTKAERAYLSVAAASNKWSHEILTSSRSELLRIQEHFPRARAHGHAVGLAPAVGITDAAPTGSIPFGGQKFILTVGRLNVRKNLRRLIEAFHLSKLSEYRLVVVGSADGLGDVNGVSTNSRVEFTGPISDTHLSNLYRQCTFFIFPSLDEGFGLPLVEASFFGAPAAASNIAAFREIGTASEYFDPLSVSGITAALQSMAAKYGQAQRLVRLNGDIPKWSDVARAARAAIFEAD